MILGLVIVVSAIGVGVWWTQIRNPVATPLQALERYAQGRAAMDTDMLVECMWVDPALYPEEGERARRRESRAKSEIGVRERVTAPASSRETKVLRVSVLTQTADRADGEIEFEFHENTGVFRSIIHVELELQDGGWRVYSVRAR